MGKAMQERNLLNVRNVGKASESALTLLSTKEFTLKRNHINAHSVIRGLDGVQILISTSHHIKDWNHINAHGVGKASVKIQISIHTKELTLERSPLHVMNVEKNLVRTLILLNTGEPTCSLCTRIFSVHSNLPPEFHCPVSSVWRILLSGALPSSLWKMQIYEAWKVFHQWKIWGYKRFTERN